MSTTTTTADAIDAVEEYAREVRARATEAKAGAGPEDRYLKGMSDGRVLTADLLLELVVRHRAPAGPTWPAAPTWAESSEDTTYTDDEGDTSPERVHRLTLTRGILADRPVEVQIVREDSPTCAGRVEVHLVDVETGKRACMMLGDLGRVLACEALTAAFDDEPNPSVFWTAE